MEFAHSFFIAWSPLMIILSVAALYLWLCNRVGLKAQEAGYDRTLFFLLSFCLSPVVGIVAAYVLVAASRVPR